MSVFGEISLCQMSFMPNGIMPNDHMPNGFKPNDPHPYMDVPKSFQEYLPGMLTEICPKTYTGLAVDLS